MEKKLYWRLDSNASDGYIIVPRLTDVTDLIVANIDGYSESECEEIEYTLSPVMMTDEEFKNLPESDEW